jgi:hypothetical protein
MVGHEKFPAQSHVVPDGLWNRSAGPPRPGASWLRRPGRPEFIRRESSAVTPGLEGGLGWCQLGPAVTWCGTWAREMPWCGPPIGGLPSPALGLVGIAVAGVKGVLVEYFEFLIGVVDHIPARL